MAVHPNLASLLAQPGTLNAGMPGAGMAQPSGLAQLLAQANARRIMMGQQGMPAAAGNPQMMPAVPTMPGAGLGGLQAALMPYGR